MKKRRCLGRFWFYIMPLLENEDGAIVCIARGFYRYMCARLHVGFDNGVAVCIDESWRVLCINRLYLLQWPIYTMKKVKSLGSDSNSPVWDSVLKCCAIYTLMLS